MTCDLGRHSSSYKLIRTWPETQEQAVPSAGLLYYCRPSRLAPLTPERNWLQKKSCGSFCRSDPSQIKLCFPQLPSFWTDSLYTKITKLHHITELTETMYHCFRQPDILLCSDSRACQAFVPSRVCLADNYYKGPFEWHYGSLVL